MTFFCKFLLREENSRKKRKKKKKKRKGKRGEKKGKKRKEKGKRKVKKGGKGRKNCIKRKRNIIILLYLTHHKSEEGNSNDISFLVYLNIDKITFPSCLGGREINMIPKKI